MLLNYGIGEESLELQGNQTSQSKRKSILNIHWRDWCWGWSSNTLATWCEELTHWKRLWCWERFKAGGEGKDRGEDGWMTSLTQWTWVWASSRSWCWTGRPGVLQPMGSQRVGYTEWLNNNCVHAHPRGGSWDKLTKRGQSKMIGLREDKDTEHCPFIKYLSFPKVGLFLSELACHGPFCTYFSFQ